MSQSVIVTTVACIFFSKFTCWVVWVLKSTLFNELLDLLTAVGYVLGLATVLIISLISAVSEHYRVYIGAWLFLHQRVGLKSLLHLLSPKCREPTSLVFNSRDIDKLTESWVAIITTILIVDISIFMPITSLRLSWVAHNPNAFIRISIDHSLTSTLVAENLSQILRYVLIDGQSFIFIQYLTYIPEALIMVILARHYLLEPELIRRTLSAVDIITSLNTALISLSIEFIDKRSIHIVVFVSSFKVNVRIIS